MNQRLYDSLLAMRPPVILVTGDLILDRYVRGNIERISPEAPAQVLEVTDEEEMLGGAANVAANVVSLGGKARLAGVAGDDIGAQSLKALLKARNIPQSDIVTDPSRPTTRKTRFIAMRQQMLRVDREKRTPVSEDIIEKILVNIHGVIEKLDGVIVSDYGKGALPDGLLSRLFTLARENGKKVLVDPKGMDYSKYAGASIITPNKKEAALASGIDIRSEDDYIKAADRLFKITGAENVIITRGEEGMSVFDRDGGHFHFPAEALEVFDVSGAGDTVIAAIGLMLFSGHTLEDSAKLANIAASIEVGHIGAWAVTKDELLRRLKPETAKNGKEMTRTHMARFTAELRESGKTVVFTNGCFDILHAGHVEYLTTAKAKGDALVIGLNSDKSVKRLKGEKRPLNSQDDRLKVLSALSCVDAVTLFDEDTPYELIKAVKPDILVKGGDYTPDTVVGRDIVEKHGGRVEIVPLVEGKSTTGIVEKIRKTHGDRS